LPAVCKQNAPLDNSRYFWLGAVATTQVEAVELRSTVEPFADPFAKRNMLVALSGLIGNPPELLELDELELLLELDELELLELELDELELLELDELELLLELEELLELDELELLLDVLPVLSISMPPARELLTTDVYWMTILPLLLALAANCWTFAIYCPPAVLKMSKAVSTCVPLIETLNVRDPAAAKKYSQKCRRTV